MNKVYLNRNFGATKDLKHSVPILIENGVPPCIITAGEFEVFENEIGDLGFEDINLSDYTFSEENGFTFELKDKSDKVAKLHSSDPKNFCLYQVATGYPAVMLGEYDIKGDYEKFITEFFSGGYAFEDQKSLFTQEQ